MNDILSQVEKFMHGALKEKLPEISLSDLEDNGAVIFYGSQQSALNIKNSAAELMRRIKEILEEDQRGI